MPGRPRPGLPAGCLYLELSILRGALQGIGDYKSVGLSLIGEQGSRLVLGAALAVVGLGVTGAYLGSLLSYVAMSLYCWWRLHGQRRPAPPLVPGSATLAGARPACGATCGERGWRSPAWP